MKNISDSNLAYAKLCGFDLDITKEYKSFRDLYRVIAPHLLTGCDLWFFRDRLVEFNERLTAIYTITYPDPSDPALIRYLVGVKHKLDSFKSMHQRLS